MAATGPPISGYSGFVPGITAENIFGKDYQHSLSVAQQQTAEQSLPAGVNPGFTDGTYLRSATAGRVWPDKAPYPAELQGSGRRIAKYGGFVQGITAENVYGKTFCDSQGCISETAASGPPAGVTPSVAAERAWWVKPNTQLQSPEGAQKVGYGGFMPRIYAENVHGETFSRAQTTAASSATDAPSRPLEPNIPISVDMPRGAEDHSQDKKLPGYGGYVPGIYAKGVFGATFESAQKLAEEALSTDQQPPATGGAAEPQEFQSKAFETATEEPEPRPAMQGAVKISGYAGFVPSIGVNNIVGENWENAQLSGQREGAHGAGLRATMTLDAKAMLTSHQTSSTPAQVEAGSTGKIPGYAGHVPKVFAQNIIGKTFEHAQLASRHQ
jgi:hypothetical protein